MEDGRVRSLAGLIEFNAEHPDIELPKTCPDQDDLIGVLSENTPDCVAKDHLAGLRRLGGKEGIDLVLDYYGIDVLAAPGDSALCELAAAAGKSQFQAEDFATERRALTEHPRLSHRRSASRCPPQQWSALRHRPDRACPS